MGGFHPRQSESARWLFLARAAVGEAATSHFARAALRAMFAGLFSGE
jgi:hypothetical protein